MERRDAESQELSTKIGLVGFLVWGFGGSISGDVHSDLVCFLCIAFPLLLCLLSASLMDVGMREPGVELKRGWGLGLDECHLLCLSLLLCFVMPCFVIYPHATYIAISRHLVTASLGLWSVGSQLQGCTHQSQVPNRGFEPRQLPLGMHGGWLASVLSPTKYSTSQSMIQW